MSNRGASKSCWKAMWNLKVLGPIKHFLWSACQDLLPTRVNLIKRKIIEYASCSICEQHNETILHVLWYCPTARDVWGENTSPLRKWAIVKNEDFWELWQSFVEKLLQQLLELVAIILLNLWLRQNNIVFDQKFDSPKKTVEISCKQHEEFLTAAATEEEETRNQQAT